ncbi:hypothetical protein FRB99_004895 [Tulasnella sp. 403]|nr:hypothetical protein FRB99_004895 [Tulasnella sp. 403]
MLDSTVKPNVNKDFTKATYRQILQHWLVGLPEDSTDNKHNDGLTDYGRTLWLRLSDNTTKQPVEIILESLAPINVSGRFGDIFIGHHPMHGKVALKRMRVTASGHTEDEIRRFNREAETWTNINHPNILHFLGAYTCSDGHLYMISPYMENGSLVDYLLNHPLADRPRLLREAAGAVAYLHAFGLVHADIKANNILVSGEGHAMLCDFGLTRFTSCLTSTTMKGAGSIRWQSPEIWNGDHKTAKSDVYAFGMAIYEVLSGKVPFFDRETEVTVMVMVIQRKERPPREPEASLEGISYSYLWDAAELCWKDDPDERPTMAEVYKMLDVPKMLASLSSAEDDIFEPKASSPGSTGIALTTIERAKRRLSSPSPRDPKRRRVDA